MGNKSSLNPQIPLIREQEWEEISLGQIDHPEFGQFCTLRNEYTGQLIDEYRVDCIDEEDYKTYIDSFIWRLKEPNIVRTMYLKEEHKQEFCSKAYMAKVYIQHIGTRLSDITDIPYPQNLYVCLSVLDGYSKLYQNLHYFRVEENQICVDSEGQVRVWLNSDLSKNYPNINEDTQGSDETYMVQQIIQLISENTDQQSEPYSLREYFINNSERGVGFEQAKVIIKEYARQQKVQIPECFESILEIYQKQEDESNQQHLEDKNEESRIIRKIEKTNNQAVNSKLKQQKDHQHIHQQYFNYHPSNANHNHPISHPIKKQITNNLINNPQLTSLTHFNQPSLRSQHIHQDSFHPQNTFRNNNPNPTHNPHIHFTNPNISPYHRVQTGSPINTFPQHFYQPITIHNHRYPNQIKPYQPYNFKDHKFYNNHPNHYSHSHYNHHSPHSINNIQRIPNNLTRNNNLSPPPSNMIHVYKDHSPTILNRSPAISQAQKPKSVNIVKINNIKQQKGILKNQQSKEQYDIVMKPMVKKQQKTLNEKQSEDNLLDEVLYEESKKILKKNNNEHPNKKPTTKPIQKVSPQKNNIQTQKAFYYTIQTQQQLDPQIAADLRNMYAFT